MSSVNFESPGVGSRGRSSDDYTEHYSRGLPGGGCTSMTRVGTGRVGMSSSMSLCFPEGGSALSSTKCVGNGGPWY